MHREITTDQAKAVRAILEEECGYRRADRFDDFVYHVATIGKDDWNVCREYRFMGELGFGGKFRNNGKRNNTPYVDCYSENETPSRREMIERANKRLAELFVEEA
jgi:hypothetical protein